MTEDELREIEARWDAATFEDERGECAQYIPEIVAEVRRLRAWMEAMRPFGDSDAVARCRGTLPQSLIDSALRGDPAP